MGKPPYIYAAVCSTLVDMILVTVINNLCLIFLFLAYLQKRTSASNWIHNIKHSEFSTKAAPDLGGHPNSTKMKTIEKILANIILAVLLTSCYFLLPITLAGAFALEGLLSSYTYVVGLLRSGYHGVLHKCLHLLVVPTLLIAMTTIYWIKSRQIDVADLLSPRRTLARLKETLKSTVDLDPLGVNRIFTGPVSVHIHKAWSWIGHYIHSKAAQEPVINGQTDVVAEEPAAEQFIIHEAAPIQELEVVAEPPAEEPEIVEVPVRVRTQEEQRLHRCIEDLEALEAEGLPETMTTEEAILLVMTRTAAANGRGVVGYCLSEKHGPHGRDHRPQIHKHRILRPHNLYYKLNTSRGNIFRPDEPDCAICFSPLVNGEAMITHDTCRRTFHETCYTEALRRSKSCPFDREWLITRSVQHTDPTPVIDPVPEDVPQPPRVYLTPPPDTRDALLQRLLAQTRPPRPQAQPPQPQAQAPQPQAQLVARLYPHARIRRSDLFGERPVIDRVAQDGIIEPPIANPTAPQAQPPRNVRGQRGRPTPAREIRFPMHGPANEHDPQEQHTETDRNRINMPRNNERLINNRRQPHIARVQNGGRRAWR